MYLFVCVSVCVCIHLCLLVHMCVCISLFMCMSILCVSFFLSLFLSVLGEDWADYYHNRFPTYQIKPEQRTLENHGVNNGQAIKSEAVWYVVCLVLFVSMFLCVVCVFDVFVVVSVDVCLSCVHVVYVHSHLSVLNMFLSLSFSV